MFFINALNQHISGRTTMRGILLGTVVCLCCIIVTLIILPVFHAAAAASTMLNFQARLMTANGAIVPDGYYNVEFKLYSGSTGGAALWTEDYYDSNGLTAGNDQRTQVKNGYLTVNLGSQTAFPTNINWDQQLFLTMNVGGTTQTATPTYDGEMNPRLQLTAVPYAFKAGDSNTLGGLSAGQFIQNQIASAQSANIFLQSASSAGNPTVQVQQASGQTGDLLQFRNSSGVLIGKVDSSANIAVGNFVDIAGTGPFLAFGAGATILDTRSAGNTGLVIKGQAIQTGDLLQLQNNIGSTLASIDASGNFNTTGQYKISGTQIASSNLSNDSNLAKLNGVQTFSAANTFSSASNSFTGSGSGLTALNASSIGSGTVNTARITGSYTGITGTGALAAGSIASGFGTISTGNTIATTSTVTGATVAATTGFKIGATNGASTTCSGNTFLQNQTVVGGITTGGTCAAAGVGSASTLQDAYDASGSTNPQIQLNNTNGGLKIRDAASSTIGSLFQLQNSGGTVTYFGVSTSGLNVQNTSAASALDFSSSTGHLKTYNPSSASNYADIYYDNTNGEAVYAASSGNTTRVGNGGGNIQLVLSNAADVLTGTKTLTLGSAYSANDFSFTRAITAGANSLTGSVVKIESTSTGTGTLSSNILLLNENNSSATGNLLVAQKNGTNKFSVDVNGNTTVSGTLTATGLVSGAAGVSIAAGQFYTGLGAVNVNSASATNLTLSAGTTGQVIAKAATNSTASFEIQNSSAGSLLTADSTNSRIYIGEPVADAVATLLVLDSYTTATDPTGVNGSMYYNTSTSRFRCQKNGTWEDCLTGRVAKKTANQSNSTTTFADVSDLTFSVAANVDYLLTCTVSYQTAATTTGIKLSVNGPASPTLVSGINQANASASTAVNNYVINGYDNGGISAGVSAANTNMVAQVQVIFRNGNNAGTLALRMASEVAASNAQINAGSYCRLEQD